MKTTLVRILPKANRRFSKLSIALSVATIAILALASTVYAVTILSEGGYLGPTYGPDVMSEPTDGRPESKLWWNDGIWWGILYNQEAGEYQIYQLDWNTQTWVSTETAVDDREDSRADVLWDGSQLYVTSHVKIENPSRVTNKDNWGRLYRYSYDSMSQTYSLDFGFDDVIVNEDKTRTLVMDKDTTGRLWVTYVSRASVSSPYKVYMNRTDGGDANWQIPFTLPFPEATVDQIDLSAVIAFEDNQGPKIGVLWTNELDDTFYFAHHKDSDPPATGWVLETGLNVPYTVNDHINLAKTSNGQVFAAIKLLETDPTKPIILLVARDLDGTFSLHPVSPADSNDSRPIALVDEGTAADGDEKVHVFVSANPTGGPICIYSSLITTPLANMSFTQRSCGDPGLAGATVILGDTTEYTKINNVTSTKQWINSTTGGVLLASDDVNGKVYAHAVLGNAPPHVVSQQPAPGTIISLRNQTVRVGFSKEMDPDTINTNTFKLEGPSGPVTGSVVYTPLNRTATFTPQTPLVEEGTYTATLTDGITDLDGMTLLNTPLSWNFQNTNQYFLYLPVTQK